MMRLLLISAFMLVTRPNTAAQVLRLNPTRHPRPAVSLGFMTVSASPSTVSFALVNGAQTAGSSPVTIATNATGLTLLGTFSLYGYFASTNALSTSGGDVIPSSAVFGRCPTGAPTSFTAFTQSGPFASGSSLLIFRASSLAGLLVGGVLTETLYLQIDLSSYPQQPAGAYSGTLILQAQAL